MSILLLTKQQRIILPVDEAATRSCIYFLSRIGPNFSVERTLNADSCSPDRLLPVTYFNGHLLTGFDSLCNAVQANKPLKSIYRVGDSNYDGDIASRSSRRIYFVWVSDVFRNIMLYFTWIHEPTYNGFTSPRLRPPGLPWLISTFVTKDKRKHYKEYFSSIGWDKKTLPNILAELEGICFGLTQLLGCGPYFFERSYPGRFDALVYGYWTVFLDFDSLFSPVIGILEKCHPVMDLIDRMRSSMANTVHDRF
ncbi:metaxin [Paragonimus westermani]|uniref:Metaxin n=1 Tax=Paragonimus westermani TaxID=34504 RepID=A0A5J4N2M8_9TREM|nr:metaxin [Paragonimus westermani]